MGSSITSIDFETDQSVNSYNSYRIGAFANKPVRVYIVFRILNQYNNGSAQTAYNALTFQHMNITNIHLRLNNTQYPKTEYNCHFNPLSVNYANNDRE